MTVILKQWLKDIYEFLIWEIFGPGCDLHLRQSRSDLQNWQDFLLAVDRQIYESCSLRSHRPGKYKFIEEQQQIYSELFMN